MQQIENGVNIHYVRNTITGAIDDFKFSEAVMFLTCIDNRAAALSDHQRPRGSVENSAYPLTAGRSYPVLGMLLWENVLNVLVPDDWGGPCFAPAGLFDLGSWEMPSDWSFGLFSGIRASGADLWTDPYGAAWGYAELVHDPEHGSALAERDDQAVAVFRQRVAEAEAARASD
ncbi:MAG TPA: hypothetical protein P5181_00855 [Dermatophilaceae bacterium]|nr:hypothetical protein [Dermatophilaceae bacterium]